MRKELEIIEQIENYLMNKLSGTDKAAFDAKIAADAGLKSEVDFQQNLVEGIQRMGLKSDTIKARRKFRTRRFLKATGITLVIIGAIAAAAYYYTNNTEGAWNFLANSEQTIETNGENEIEEIVPIFIAENDSLSSDANAYLDQELFEIKTDRDTVIESEEGIIVFIPANAFGTENEQVEFLIQEALTPADILYAGLNTMTADGEELETGGMFYFDAFANGERVPLSKELTVDIPANPDKTGMQLYEGIENEAGELLWTNPKPFTKPLVPVEITELDFYPKGYEPKMEEWGYLNKQFKDSLYYSYAAECGLDDRPLIGLSDTTVSIEEWPEAINSDNVSTLNPTLMFMPLAPQDEMPNTIDDVINWNFSVSYSGDMATITMIANQQNGWHIYSQVQPDGAIPLPTEFDFNDGKNLDKDFKLMGSTIEYGAKLFDNDGFPEKSFHGNRAKFVQKIKILSEKDFEIDLYYGYMACKTACLPPEYRNEVIKISGLNDLLATDDCTECGVNPASVKTIWNSKFNNTNLATKEFEARMPFIHQTCNNSILELYVNNLDKNLCSIDSMAMKRLSGSNREAFSNFALKGHGQVTVKTNAQQKLNAYYDLKKQALQAAITKTNAEFWADENKLNAEMTRKDQEAQNRNTKSNRRLNKQEVEFNTREVYGQLGLRKPRPRSTRPVVFNNTATSNLIVESVAVNAIEEKIETPTTPINPNRPFLRTIIRRTGWRNADCLIRVSSMRESANIRGANGRIAAVKYSKMAVTVNDASNYDRLNVYAISNKFNSYIKLKSDQGSFEYKLNEKISYSVIGIAWNNKGMFYSKIDGAAGTSAMQLLPITKAEWEGKIKASLGNINNMQDELNYLEYANKDQNRKNKNSAKRNLRNKARRYVFPCKCSLGVNNETGAVDQLLSEAVVFNDEILADVANNGNQADLVKITGLKFPSLFSPNGDRNSDYFNVSETNLATFSITIFDERGDLVFSSEDPSFKWYGKDANGRQLPAGLYSYNARAKDNDGGARGSDGIVKLIRE